MLMPTKCCSRNAGGGCSSVKRLLNRNCFLHEVLHDERWSVCSHSSGTEMSLNGFEAILVQSFQHSSYRRNWQSQLVADFVQNVIHRCGFRFVYRQREEFGDSDAVPERSVLVFLLHLFAALPVKDFFQPE